MVGRKVIVAASKVTRRESDPAELESRRDFLLACATWQDGLLQSYRSISLTVSSILIAVGVGSVVAAIEQTSEAYSLSISLFVVLLGVFSIILTERFQEVILSRGRDVDYWHRQIIKLEGKVQADQRFFTQFKIAQKESRSRYSVATDAEPPKDLTDEEITFVIGSGLGHTRRFVDRSLVVGMRFLWVVILFGAVANIAQRLL